MNERGKDGQDEVREAPDQQVARKCNDGRQMISDLPLESHSPNCLPTLTKSSNPCWVLEYIEIPDFQLLGVGFYRMPASNIDARLQ